MTNAIGLEDVMIGDTVAYFRGCGSNMPPEKMKVARITKLYIILEGQSYNKFKKENGVVVDCTLGKIERIAIPTPEIEAQWEREKLIVEFTELMNRRKFANSEIIALRKVIQQLLSEELTQDELIEIAASVIECKSLSNQALQESVNELWGSVYF